MPSGAACEREMRRHRDGYLAYVAARDAARSGRTAGERKEAAARQEEHRPAYTAYKRAYARLLKAAKGAGVIPWGEPPAFDALTCPDARCAELNDPEAPRCESCGTPLGLRLVATADLEFARRLYREYGPGRPLRGSELAALERAAADPLYRPANGRDRRRLTRALQTVERAAALLETREGGGD